MRIRCSDSAADAKALKPSTQEAHSRSPERQRRTTSRSQTRQRRIANLLLRGQSGACHVSGRYSSPDADIKQPVALALDVADTQLGALARCGFAGRPYRDLDGHLKRRRYS